MALHTLLPCGKHIPTKVATNIASDATVRGNAFPLVPHRPTFGRAGGSQELKHSLHINSNLCQVAANLISFYIEAWYMPSWVAGSFHIKMGCIKIS